ncbi:type VI secretion system baseplate subunit TssK [Pseudomonas sp. SDO5271_S396]
MDYSEKLCAHYLELALLPCSQTSFAGDDMRFSNEYEALEAEWRKAQSIHGMGQPDWQKIIDISECLLRQHTKDLRVVVWLTWALHQRESYAGLLAGLGLLRHLCEHQWAVVYPEKTRTRAAAFSALVLRLEPLFAQPLSLQDQQPLFQSVLKHLIRLDELWTLHLGEEAPLLLPVRRQLAQRLEHLVESEEPQASGVIAQVKQAATRLFTPETVVDNEKDAHRVLRMLQEQARVLCTWWLRQSATDLRALRLSRTLAWLAVGNSHCQIRCAQPDLRLLLGEQHDDQTYVRLKVAQVSSSTGEGVISLEGEFVPTFIYLQDSRYVSACLKEVISLMANRGDAIAERLRGNGTTAGTEVGDFLMLQLINRTEPVLRHYLTQPQVRPEVLYRTLLAILGELCTFANDSKRPQMAGCYLHSDQGLSFRELMDAMRSVLSMVLEQHAIELVLQPRQYGVMVCPVSDPTLLESATFILAASAQCESEELRQRLPAHLKVGSVERIRELVNLHLAGIKVKPLPVAPRQIPFHAGKTYFLLDLSAHDSAQLARSGGFAFHVSGEFPGLALDFWAIRN